MITTKEKRAVLGKESAFNKNNYLTDRQKNNNRQSVSVQRATAKQTHQIYNSLLHILENKQIQIISSGDVLPFALHKSTVEGLRKFYGLSRNDIQNIEDSIFRDIENMRDYQTTMDAPPSLFNELEKINATDKIIDSRAVAIPNRINNALICARLLRTFSADQLLTVPGFVSAGEFGGSVRLDIGEHLCRRGFMMPVLPNGLITGLKVFRSPDDETPFILRSRNSNIGGQNTW